MFRLAREKAEKLQSQENEEKASIMSAQIEKSRKRREGEPHELAFLKVRRMSAAVRSLVSCMMNY